VVTFTPEAASLRICELIVGSVTSPYPDEPGHHGDPAQVGHDLPDRPQRPERQPDAE
jgi:hypothetical protein